MSVLDNRGVILYNYCILCGEVKLLKEIRTGGTKEFIYSVLWAVLILFIGKYLIYLLPSYKLFGGIATVIMFCVLGFFVMTRYSAVYTYDLTGYTLHIDRRIGGRNKELSIKVSDIKGIYNKKQGSFKHRNIYVMCASVFALGRKRLYIQFCADGEDVLLVFEPSDAMAEKIKVLMRSVNNG